MTDRSDYVGHQDSAKTPVRVSRYHRPPPLPQEGTPLLALWKRPDTAGFELIERAMPAMGSDDVLIRVHRTGICGTDLHIESWDPWAAGAVDAPLVPGHEFSGEVVEVGSRVEGIPVGAAVSGEGHLVCGTCRNCRSGRRHLCRHTRGLGVNLDGAFAEYVVLPATNVWVHGDQVTPDLGALFDPLGNAVHTALSFPILGEDVLITGCGPIGLMAIAVCRVAGARNIVATDVVADRLEKALAVGADRVVDVSKERVADAQAELGMLEGFDIGLEMSGQAAAASELIENLNTGGKVALLGLPSTNIEIDWTKVITRMITIKGIYGREMFDTWHHASAMVDHSPELRNALESLVTARFPLASWQDAFDTARGGAAGKVLIDWTDIRDVVITGLVDEQAPVAAHAATAA